MVDPLPEFFETIRPSTIRNRYVRGLCSFLAHIKNETADSKEGDSRFAVRAKSDPSRLSKSKYFDFGLRRVATSFAIIAGLNLVTSLIGPQKLLAELAAYKWGMFTSIIVFDSWGTVGGLLGVVVLFIPLLAAARGDERKELSNFFVGGTVVCGYAAFVVWNVFLGGGKLGYGASSIPIAAQSVLFCLSIFGLARMASENVESSNSWLPRSFFAMVYFVIISSTLVLVLLLQPIFVPTNAYNWQAHELAFLLGLAVTSIYCWKVRNRKFH
jgi:hypothetical protein